MSEIKFKMQKSGVVEWAGDDFLLMQNTLLFIVQSILPNKNCILNGCEVTTTDDHYKISNGLVLIDNEVFGFAGYEGYLNDGYLKGYFIAIKEFEERPYTDFIEKVAQINKAVFERNKPTNGSSFLELNFSIQESYKTPRLEMFTKPLLGSEKYFKFLLDTINKWHYTGDNDPMQYFSLEEIKLIRRENDYFMPNATIFWKNRLLNFTSCPVDTLNKYDIALCYDNIEDKGVYLIVSEIDTTRHIKICTLENRIFNFFEILETKLNFAEKSDLEKKANAFREFNIEKDIILSGAAHKEELSSSFENYSIIFADVEFQSDENHNITVHSSSSSNPFQTLVATNTAKKERIQIPIQNKSFYIKSEWFSDTSFKITIKGAM